MKRRSRYKINQWILQRTSPRIMSGAVLRERDLMPLFEAARWAPSSYNAQLWKFIYMLRGSQNFHKTLALLHPGNQVWAKQAGALIIVATGKYFEHSRRVSRTAAFDAGAACQNLALEGFQRDFAVHLMEGFDHQKVSKLCQIPRDHDLLVIIAIGNKVGPKEKASGRKPLRTIVMKDRFHKRR